MALALFADRVKETTSTTGTGTVTLEGASAGFQTFVSGIGDSNYCYYCISDGTNWEVGYGQVTDAASDTLSRNTVISNSLGTTALINFTTGTKDVWCTLPGLRTPLIENNLQLVNSNQYAMSAYLTSSADNVTGNSTIYPLTGWTEEYDIGACFNATSGVYTAPIEGVYHFSGTVICHDLAVGANGTVWLECHGVGSPSTVRRYYCGRIWEAGDPNDVFSVSISADIHLDATETVDLRIQVAGVGSDAVDVNGFAFTTDRFTWLTIRLTHAIGA